MGLAARGLRCTRNPSGTRTPGTRDREPPSPRGTPRVLTRTPPCAARCSSRHSGRTRRRHGAPGCGEQFRQGAEGWADESIALSLPRDFDPKDVRCSVTWWHGKHDANNPISAVRRLLAHVPEVDLRVSPEAGHLEPVHRHDEIVAELLARSG